MSKFDDTNPRRIEALRAASFALQSTCQLYQWKNVEAGTFVANGCTILFQHNESYYCFSNAHVLADIHLGKTFFLLRDGIAMSVGGEHFYSMPLSSEKRKDDSLDIAIVKLNSEVATRLLQNGDVFLTLTQIYTLPKLVRGHTLLIAGYPASKTKIDIKTSKIKFAPLIVRTVPYLKTIKNVEFTKGFHHIAEFPIKSFKETSTGQKMRAPQPHGISGSGLWLYPNANEKNPSPKLIGILAEYHENNAVVISTKIDLFLDLTKQRFDSSIQHDGIKIDLEYEEK